jgi:hypothetical protein
MSDSVLDEIYLEKAVNGAFAILGPQIATTMKDRLNQNGSEDTMRLENSITWATPVAVDTVMGKGNPTDIIQKPTTKYTMHVGTAVPYAPYVEHGSTPHGGSNAAEHERFVTNMLDWARRHGWEARDGGELKESDIYYLLKKIRDNGTSDMPFVAPTKTEYEGKIGPMFRAAITPRIREAFGKRKGTKTVIDIRIS